MAVPERFAEKSDLLLQRGHRPYMAKTTDIVPQQNVGLWGVSSTGQTGSD